MPVRQADTSFNLLRGKEGWVN